MRSIRTGLLLGASIFIAACGGGGGDGGGGTASQPPPATSTAGIPINATYQQGSYIEFAVNSETTTFAQPSTTTSSSDFGVFRITLGAPTTIGGATVYPIAVSGDPNVGGRDWTPRWKHIGIQNGSVVGSTNGTTLQTVYNGATSNGLAAGFFISFSSENVKASNGTFTGDYNSLPAVLASHSSSSGGCQTILGVTLCSDSSTKFSETEYFKNGIGPIGYAQDTSYSSSGGGFFTSTTIRLRVEIVGTSLTPADGSTIRPAPWQDLAPMAAARKSVTASAYNNQIYVFGGLDAANTSLATVEIYNPATNTWAPGVSAPVGLGFYKAKTIGSKTYLIRQSTAVRIFDHLTNTWGTGAVAPFSDPSFDLDVWVGAQTFVIVASSNLSPPRIDVQGYDVNLNSWGPKTSLNTTDHRFFAISVVGNSFYLAGGFRQSVPDTFKGTYRYDLLANTWTTVGLALTDIPRVDPRAVNLSGAMVLLGGHVANSSQSYRDVESYSVAANGWSALPRMLRARNGHAAVVLNGKIYVIGGQDGASAPIASAEVYTP